MISVRVYGDAGPLVVLLHGGPGAPGYLAPLAHLLAERGLRVLEPFQRGGSTKAPLTVARHVADLEALLAERCPGETPAVVGHSWGAMLALAHAAAHPERAARVVLIGCGTFDAAARASFEAALATRLVGLGTDLRRRFDQLPEMVADPDARLAALGDLLIAPYSVDPLVEHLEVEADALAHQQSWDDMVGLQREGVYPAAFSAITAPVLMLHGAEDPHPGTLIRDSLTPHIPQLAYQEWPGCGHYPWIERAAREPFVEHLAAWIKE